MVSPQLSPAFSRLLSLPVLQKDKTSRRNIFNNINNININIIIITIINISINISIHCISSSSWGSTSSCVVVVRQT